LLELKKKTFSFSDQVCEGLRIESGTPASRKRWLRLPVSGISDSFHHLELQFKVEVVVGYFGIAMPSPAVLKNCYVTVKQFKLL
jgi:hypothetical protein